MTDESIHSAAEREASSRTPDSGVPPKDEDIESTTPEEFGLVQVWWGDGKGKTTAALGMGFRAVGHGYRVHVLQFMKGGASSVENVRGEYNAIGAIPGMSYENSGHYGWHGLRDGTDEDDHAARARRGLERARKLLTSWDDSDLESNLPLEGPPEDGVHMLILDEILYAANRDLISPNTVVSLIEAKSERLELVLTGGHEKPTYVYDHADLVTNVQKEKHPFDAEHRARKGTEY
jgi:cob(I)alamin adenosyltransferase